MKIYFVRHGEAMDDIRNEYGGWADAELSKKGRQQISERASDLIAQGITAQIIFTSPLKRAK